MSNKVEKVIGRNSKKGTKQINPATPKQKMLKQHGSKDALVDAIIALYDAPEGSKGKLKQVSNSKLMTHLHNTKRMVAQFSTRIGVIDAILAARYPHGNAPAGEKTKLLAAPPWRLMDLHRQVTGTVK
jgi:hypothetical protein